LPFTIGIVAAAFHAIWQLRHLDIADPGCCLALFRANRDFGLMIFAGAVLDSLARGDANP
jgi:4-hydroxybenzoate polyprenyltransferase